jgi:hypothetical protein
VPVPPKPVPVRKLDHELDIERFPFGPEDEELIGRGRTPVPVPSGTLVGKGGGTLVGNDAELLSEKGTWSPHVKIYR